MTKKKTTKKMMPLRKAKIRRSIEPLREIAEDRAAAPRGSKIIKYSAAVAATGLGLAAGTALFFLLRERRPRGKSSHGKHTAAAEAEGVRSELHEGRALFLRRHATHQTAKSSGTEARQKNLLKDIKHRLGGREILKGFHRTPSARRTSQQS